MVIISLLYSIIIVILSMGGKVIYILLRGIMFIKSLRSIIKVIAMAVILYLEGKIILMTSLL